MIYDHNKHGDEYRLRLLLTDACNLDCHFCLNDFQPKPLLSGTFLDPIKARDHILAYAAVVAEKHLKHRPLINLSGGEPGLHPDLLSIVKACREVRARTMLNTNGLVLKHRDWDEVRNLINDLRIHVHPGQFERYEHISHCDVSVQVVFDYTVSDAAAEKLVFHYGGRGVPIKFFVDFKALPETVERYENFILNMREKYSDYKIEARFTGIQQNRGIGCVGCTKKCITLKALWVFPDGANSPCPQGQAPKAYPPAPHLLHHAALGAFNFHKLSEETT